MSTTGVHVRNRHTQGIGAAGVFSRDTHNSGGFDPIPTDEYYGGIIDYEMIGSPDVPVDVLPPVEPFDPATLPPGWLPPTAFDPTPPAAPTGLTMSSDVVADADGHSILRLVFTLVHPTDADLYGTWVEFTNRYTYDAGGVISGPVWDSPSKVFLPATATKATVEGVAGMAVYYARAYAVDVQANRSAYSAVVSFTTTKDVEAPPIPQGLDVVAGYRGFGASWDASAAGDLMFNEIRYAPDIGTGLAPDTANWVTVRARTNSIFIGSLVGEARYWCQVRAVDLSGNVDVRSIGPAYDALLLASAPWGYWRLGEASGQALDSSPNARHGTWTGTVDRGVPGLLLGDADAASRVIAPGVIKYVSLGNTAIIVHSIVVWFQRLGDPNGSASNGYHELVHAVQGGSTGSLYLYPAGDRIMYQVRDSAGATVTVSSPVLTHDVAAPHMWAGTYDGATARIYCDGVEIVSQAVSMSTSVAATPTTILRNSTNYNANGIIDEVAIWDRVLSAAEVGSFYDAGHPFSYGVALAVDYLANPESGWSAVQSVLTTLIGSEDIGFGAITAGHISVGALSADVIGAGTLVIRPTDGFADGIEVQDAAGVVIGRWDEFGIKITDPTNPLRYVLLAGGELKFTNDGGVNFPAAITPEGIDASRINFGSLSGGHNLVLNSSFELANFQAAPATNAFTDTSKWAVANRTVVPDNVTEGTALVMTAAGFA